MLIAVTGLAGCQAPLNPADRPLTHGEDPMAATFTAIESIQDDTISFADWNNDGQVDFNWIQLGSQPGW